MKKSGALTLIILLVLSVAGIATYFVLTLREDIDVMLAPTEIYFPKECSETEIKAVWDSIFEISSENIFITWNSTIADMDGTCPVYYAYKNTSKNETYVMAGYSVQETNSENGPYVELNHSQIFFYYGNLTSIDTDFMESYTPEFIGNPFFIFGIVAMGSYMDSVCHTWETTPITPAIRYKEQFNYENDNAFNWDEPVYQLSETSTDSSTEGNFTIGDNATVIATIHGSNQTMAYVGTTTQYISCTPDWTCSDWSDCTDGEETRTCTDQKNCGIPFEKPEETKSCGCTANWTAQETDCNETTEELTIYYIDDEECGEEPPDNETGYCDADNNDLIGEEDDIDTDNMEDLFVKIDDEDIEYEDGYEGEQDIEIIEEIDDDDEVVRVEFEHDFDDGPLNFKTIKITKQDEDDDIGYLIVEGIEDNNKEFRVDIIENSGAICVKDRSNVDDEDDIEDDCDDDDEIYMECPEEEEDIECTEESGYFLITGLDNSGVKEIKTEDLRGSDGDDEDNEDDCTVDWDCTLWSSCEGGTQYSTCTDYGDCNNATPVYNKTRTCQEECTPSFDDCTDWAPEDCEADETQTRTCSDSNNCADDEEQSRICPTNDEGIDWMLILLIAIGVLILGAAVILIIVVKKRRDRMNPYEEKDPIQILTKPPAGSYGKTHYGRSTGGSGPSGPSSPGGPNRPGGFRPGGPGGPNKGFRR